MNVSFTPVLASDADSLADLRVQAMRASLERVGRFDPARTRARLLDGFAAEHTRWITVDGERVGFFVLKPQDEGLLLEHLYIRFQLLREEEFDNYYVRHAA